MVGPGPARLACLCKGEPGDYHVAKGECCVRGRGERNDAPTSRSAVASSFSLRKLRTSQMGEPSVLLHCFRLMWLKNAQNPCSQRKWHTWVPSWGGLIYMLLYAKARQNRLSRVVREVLCISH